MGRDPRGTHGHASEVSSPPSVCVHMCGGLCLLWAAEVTWIFFLLGGTEDTCTAHRPANPSARSDTGGVATPDLLRPITSADVYTCRRDWARSKA